MRSLARYLHNLETMRAIDHANLQLLRAYSVAVEAGFTADELAWFRRPIGGK